MSTISKGENKCIIHKLQIDDIVYLSFSNEAKVKLKL